MKLDRLSHTPHPPRCSNLTHHASRITVRASRLTRHAWCLAVVVGLLAGTSQASAAPKKYGEEAVARLVEIVQAEREPENRRAKACRELEHTEIRTHLSVLRRILREERSPDIRLAAACTLAALGDTRAPRDTLLATAYEGSRTATCSRSDVLIALGRVGDPAGVMHLEKALKSEVPEDEPYFYNDACRALRMLDSPEANRALLHALRDGNAAVRHATISPLSGVATDRDNPDREDAKAAIIRAALIDPDEKVAEQAASALFWSGVAGAAFYEMLEKNPEPAVRIRAARVLNRHYLNEVRVKRLQAAFARETHPEVRAAMEKTLAGQKLP